MLLIIPTKSYNVIIDIWHKQRENLFSVHAINTQVSDIKYTIACFDSVNDNIVSLIIPLEHDRSYTQNIARLE